VEQSQPVTAYTPPQRNAREIAALDTDDATAPDSTGIGKMRWPVRGRVITAFGASEAGKANDGIDISVPEGTSVRAAENGVVIYAGDGLKEFGNTVLIRHDDGLVTVYGHNSSIKVQRGANVRRGDEIALSGLSGSANTPRLHFEVRKESTPVNPMTFLE
jgi:murein DD-endopeptidase MepM/ murein hydrolase activator NlpD